MLGTMMHRPLSIIEILEYAAQVHAAGELVSVRTEGDIHRQTYKETLGRVSQLAHALKAMGVKIGDRVATLAWNGHRHFELYYAISGIGAVCHTINPRLSAEQFIYIVNHAEDRVLFVDTTFLPLVAKLRDDLPADLRIVVMTDEAHAPESPIAYDLYEPLLQGKDERFPWPPLPEDTAAGLCYTSGTTGDPKGALYSHRSSVLHALFAAVALPNLMHERSRLLPVVPLFHVNAWGIPYIAPMVGASLVFPGAALDGASVFDLMENEGVTCAFGVPTVWLGLQNEIAKRGAMPSRFTDLVVGGSAAPKPMIETFEKWGASVCHAWGMTEMSPIGTHGNLPAAMDNAPMDERVEYKAKQGRRMFGCDLKIVDEDGRALPQDGESAGELFVRGNAVISSYFNNAEASAAAFDQDGWFGTGDVATIDEAGFLNITDRAKDLIKSGGEWISSLDLESVAMAHPKVANCAVIAVPHSKWDERPLLVVMPTPDGEPDKQELKDLIAASFAKWQVPDDVAFVEALPLTATGKVSKRMLRSQFADFRMPDDRAA